jgi:hypothetical protein
MPLIEPTRAFIALLLWYMRRDMEIDMIDTLDLEAGGKVEVVFGDFAAAEDVNLGLGVDGWSVGKAVDGYPVFGKEDGVEAVCEAACFFFGVEASNCQQDCLWSELG